MNPPTRMNFVYALPLSCSLPELTSLPSGFLHSLLDVLIHLYPPKLCAQHRNTRASSQPSLCNHVFARCYHSRFKRWRSRSQHRGLRPVCKGTEEWVVKIRLDRGNLTTPAADYHTLWCHLLDIQSVGMSLNTTSLHLNHDTVTGTGHGFNQDF
jgi:hypothetical protein